MIIFNVDSDGEYFGTDAQIASAMSPFCECVTEM